MQNATSATFEHKGKKMKITIAQDEGAASPREINDTLGILACAHRRYSLGDEQLQDTTSLEENIKRLKKDEGAIHPKIVYLYDHSGITISLTPFSCPWDSGIVGVIYTTKKKCKEFGIHPKATKTIERLLDSEIKAYDRYLRGEIYAVILEEIIACQHCNSSEYEIIDSLFGIDSEGTYGKELLALCVKSLGLDKEIEKKAIDALIASED